MTLLRDDIVDEDEFVMAVPAMFLTRGRARAILTRAQEVPFTYGHVRLVHLKRDPELPNATIACHPSVSGATPYWMWTP